METFFREFMELFCAAEAALIDCGIDRARRSLLLGFVGTYLPLSSSEQVEFNQIVSTKPEYQQVEQMVSVFMKEGIERGREEGRAEALQLLLAKRFGPLDEAVTQRIRQLHSVERLDALLLAALDARSLDEMPW